VQRALRVGLGVILPNTIAISNRCGKSRFLNV